MITVIRGSLVTCLLHAHIELKSVAEGADTSSLSTTLSWMGVQAVNNTVMISLDLQNWQAHWNLKLNHSILKCVFSFCHTCIISHEVSKWWLCWNELLLWGKQCNNYLKGLSKTQVLAEQLKRQACLTLHRRTFNNWIKFWNK